MLRPALLLLCIAAAACRGGAGEDPGTPDAGQASPPDAGPDYPPPRADLVPPVGSPDAIDIATWNIENFPATADTPRLMADLITSLGLDLVAVQEIADEAAFDELVARLPRHGGVLSSHTYGNGEYQKVGFVYREDLLRVDGGALLFQSQGYDFPRPPLQVRVAVLGPGGEPTLELAAITVHLKAGTGSDDRERRRAAMVTLEAHVRDLVDSGTETEVVLLGDFNEHLEEEYAREVFAPFLDAPADYQVRTDALPESARTFIPSGRVVDHVITTAALGDDMSGAAPVIPPLDSQLGGYVDTVSDHLPVVAAMPLD